MRKWCKEVGKLAKNEIRTKIILEGNDGYLQALKEIKQGIRELRQEYEQLNETVEISNKLLKESAISQR